MAVKPDVPETAVAVDVKEAIARRRLIRALDEPEVLDDLLLDPEGVAERYEVSLDEQEIDAIRRAGRFATEWDRRVGEGRWHEVVIEARGRRRRSRPAVLVDAVDRAVQIRAAEELMEDLPEAIRRAADRFGAEAFVRADREDDPLPEHLRPLRRLVRNIADRIRRDLEREVDRIALLELAARRRPVPESAPDREAEPVAEIERRQIVPELRRRLDEVTTNAVAQAVERARPVSERVRDRAERARAVVVASRD